MGVCSCDFPANIFSASQIHFANQHPKKKLRRRHDLEATTQKKASKLELELETLIDVDRGQ